MSHQIAFFLGANTPEGFMSLYPHLAEEPGLRISAVKSGPGCGKSTFLRSIAAWEEPMRRELFHCSSDPESLDGVLLHSRGMAVLDGTAPHVYDPLFPGAQGEYIAAPDFLDPVGLAAKRGQLEALKARSGACYAQAYRLLEAAALVQARMRAALEPHLPRTQLLRRAQGIAARELPRSMASGKPGVLRQRFLDGMTPKGAMFLRDTVQTLAQKVYLLEDRFGLGSFMLELWRDRALELGLEVYACPDIHDPRRLLHLILPELSLAFVTEDGSRMPQYDAYRAIRVEAYLPADVLRENRGKLRLLSKLRESLLEDATGELAQAHAIHDEMEALYRPHLDISALAQLQQQFFEKEASISRKQK